MNIVVLKTVCYVSAFNDEEQVSVEFDTGKPMSDVLRSEKRLAESTHVFHYKDTRQLIPSETHVANVESSAANPLIMKKIG